MPVIRSGQKGLIEQLIKGLILKAFQPIQDYFMESSSLHVSVYIFGLVL